MKFKVYLSINLFIIIIVYVASCRHLGEWLVKEDFPVHSDAIVVNMGSVADWILQAIGLYQSGFADRVLIVDVEMAT